MVTVTFDAHRVFQKLSPRPDSLGKSAVSANQAHASGLPGFPEGRRAGLVTLSAGRQGPDEAPRFQTMVPTRLLPGARTARASALMG